MPDTNKTLVVGEAADMVPDTGDGQRPPVTPGLARRPSRVADTPVVPGEKAVGDGEALGGVAEHVAWRLAQGAFRYLVLSWRGSYEA